MGPVQRTAWLNRVWYTALVFPSYNAYGKVVCVGTGTSDSRWLTGVSSCISGVLTSGPKLLGSCRSERLAVAGDIITGCEHSEVVWCGGLSVTGSWALSRELIS